MSKVIKKTMSVNNPVIIESVQAKNSTKRVKKAGKIIPETLALTDVITSEINEWKEKAREKALAQVRENTKEREKAFQEGYNKGMEDGIQRERDERMKSIDALLKEAKKKSAHAIQKLEVKVVELAVAIAEKLMRKSIESDPSITENIVSDTMSYIIGSETVVLKVSPEDFKTINAKYNAWLSMAGSAQEFRIEIDKRLRTGDFIVETEGGIIDAVVEDRIDVLVEELLKVSQ